MTGELIINGKDAYTMWGVNMGDKFLDTLDEKVGKKEYITNDNKLKDGIEYCDAIPKSNERQITLTFTIMGSNRADFTTKKDAFFDELDKGNVTIQVPANDAKVYHLKFKDSTGAYAKNTKRTFCKVGVKFTEPNPKNRK